MIVRLQFKDGSIRRRERNRPDRWALGQAQGKNRSRKKVAVVDNESSDIEKSFFLLVSNLMPISADSTTTLIELKDDKSIE